MGRVLYRSGAVVARGAGRAVPTVVGHRPRRRRGRRREGAASLRCAARGRAGDRAGDRLHPQGLLRGGRGQARAGASPDDFPAYSEARSVYLAAPGDLVVGRGEAWRQAVAASEAVPVEVDEPRYYYLTHALLTLAASEPSDRPAPPLALLIRQLRDVPATVVRLFAMDAEARLLLLWLKRAAGLDVLGVDANGPEVAEGWNRKTTLYPTPEAARTLGGPVSPGEPGALLDAEFALTPFHAEFGVVLPRLPGYSISRAGADETSMSRQVREAAGLLVERYGLELGCFKPAEALTGDRIRTAVPLADADTLDALARQAMESEEDYVLEAHTHYLRHRVPGYEFILAPSVHVAAGGLAEGGTVQITRGSVWEGSVYVDEGTCARFGITPEQFRTAREGMAGLYEAFRGRAATSVSSRAVSTSRSPGWAAGSDRPRWSPCRISISPRTARSTYGRCWPRPGSGPDAGTGCTRPRRWCARPPTPI